MKRFVVCFAVSALLGPIEAGAQEPVDLQAIERIKAEGLERSQVLDIFGALTDVFGPRLTATPAYKAAANWAAKSLEAWGMENVHLESWEFGRGWTLDHFTLEMVEPRYFPMIGYPEAWTPPTRGEIVTAPVFIGDKTADEIRAMASELRGAVVLPVPTQDTFITEDRQQPTEFEERVRIGAPRTIRTAGPVGRRDLPALLQEVGAAVQLRPSQGAHGTMFVLGRRQTTDDAVPTVVVAGEHYNMLVRMVQRGVDVKLRVNVQATYHEDDTNGYNVIAEIPGTDPDLRDEVVMLGAHLDSWHSAPGATDNADGVATTMEAMRILKAINVAPRRTIRLALWGGEEQGLLGSREYVQRHLAGDENRTQRDNLSVYFNHDPGTGPIYGFYLEENSAAKPILDAWLEPLRDLGARRNVIDKIGSTDHLSFIRAGIPGFNTVQDYTDYDVRTHHTNMDTFERLSEADLMESAVLLATFVYHAAMRDEKIPRGPR